jgi:hypothetical protein
MNINIKWAEIMTASAGRGSMLPLMLERFLAYFVTSPAMNSGIT